MLTIIVADKNGKALTDEELENKVIDKQEYYAHVIPMRNRLNAELQQGTQTKKAVEKSFGIVYSKRC